MSRVLETMLAIGCALVLQGACAQGDNGTGTIPVDASGSTGGASAASGGMNAVGGKGGGGSAGQVGTDASRDAPSAAVDAQPDAGGGDAGRPPPLTWTRRDIPVFTRGIGGARDEVWVVGEDGGIVTSRGDDVWTRRITDTRARLTGAWGTGADDVYVSVFQNFVLHWKAGQWIHEYRGIPAGTTFDGVWGRTADEVYAISGGIFRSAGDGVWSRVPIADESGTITSLWSGGANDFWTIDNFSSAYHVREGQRVIERTGLPIRGVGIWGSGLSDLYAAATAGVARSHADGKWVIEVQFEAMRVGARGLWGADASNVFVATNDGRLWRSSGDGQWWPEVIDPVLLDKNAVVGIWGTDARNVYVVTSSAVYHGR